MTTQSDSRYAEPRALPFSLEQLLQMQRQIMGEITSKFRTLDALNNQLLGVEMAMSALEVHHR